MSSRELSAAAVSERLGRLRSIAGSETVDETRNRLAVDAREEVPFATAVAQRLAELRALCELTNYLHRR